MHWADVLAKELAELRPAPHVLATAITPSGPIHVGNMREVLTTEAVHRAAQDAGLAARLIYIADDYDPLRKVYPFLEGHATIDYAKEVGKPLREIPCPCAQHASYAEHFLEPFLGNLGALGVRPEIMSAYDLYRDGGYTPSVLRALERWSTCRQVLEEVAGRKLEPGWAPFNPQCPRCRRLSGVKVLGYEAPMLRFSCGCGETGELDARHGGTGKLPWRIDWPARWSFLGVTFEAFGKDHGAAGGSWDTGVRLVREVFDGIEPHHTMYEFLHLKGQGAMHSSTGLAISAADLLRMTPPEVLRYLMVRQSPRKHIDFDPGLGLLGLVEEFDRHERVRFGAEANPGDITEVERTYGLSCPGPPPATLPSQVGIRHLVTVVQLADTVEGVVEILARGGIRVDGEGRKRLEDRVAHVRHWLATFAPETVRFRVQPALPSFSGLDDADRAFLGDLGQRLRSAAWEPAALHDLIHEAAQASGRSQPQAFRAVYRAILGQDRGPRAGFFLASLERAWVVARFAEAAGAS